MFKSICRIKNLKITDETCSFTVEYKNFIVDIAYIKDYAVHKQNKKYKYNNFKIETRRSDYFYCEPEFSRYGWCLSLPLSIVQYKSITSVKKQVTEMTKIIKFLQKTFDKYFPGAKLEYVPSEFAKMMVRGTDPMSAIVNDALGISGH